MKVLIYDTYEQLCLASADFLKERLKRKPNLVLGLASGGTVVGFYQALRGSTSFSQAKFFNLDEYLGLSKDSKNSFSYFLNDVFLSQVKAKEKNIRLLNGACQDYKKECVQYLSAIKKQGGIDLQILGLGSNGHLAFNEPNSSFASVCRLIELSPQTRRDNSRFFKSLEDVPKQALTLGLKDILGAKEVILLASGKNKAKAVKALVEGAITTKWPCSLLQKHKKATIFLDKEAAGRLTRLPKQ